MSGRGFAPDGVDDPRRDFMATYFDRDDDVTRGMVEDYLDRIVAAERKPHGLDVSRIVAAVERVVTEQALNTPLNREALLAVVRAAAVGRDEREP